MGRKITSRADFQRLSGVRVEESGALLSVGQWSGAYYLAGYAVELGLKVLVIKRLMAADEFPGKKFSSDCYTHDLEDLFTLAGVEAAWKLARGVDPGLEANWRTVKLWTEESRYYEWDESETRALHAAVADVNSGVHTWLKGRW